MNHSIFSWLLILWWQELVKHAIQRGELADFFVAHQVDAVETGGERFESAQVAVITKKVVQQARGKAVAFRAAAGSHASDSGEQTIGMKAALGDDFFDALGFFAKNQSVLDLLGVHFWRIFGEQRNGFVGSDDVR